MVHKLNLLTWGLYLGWPTDFLTFDTRDQIWWLYPKMIPLVVLKHPRKYRKNSMSVTCFIAQNRFCPKSTIFGRCNHILLSHSNTNQTDIDWYYRKKFLRVTYNCLVSNPEKNSVTWLSWIFDFLKKYDYSSSRDVINFTSRIRKIQ